MTGVTSLPTNALTREPIVQPGGEDMNVDVEPRQSRWSRLILLAGGIGLAWCAVTAFGQTSSASAAEEDPQGLLGVVSSTVQQTTSAVTDVIGAVEPVVVEVAHVVAPPAPAPAPAPHTPAPVVLPAIQGVANVATTTVAGVTGAATSALHGTADTVDVVTGVVADTTSAIVSDVSLAQVLTPLLDVIDGLPVLGAVTTEVGVTDTLGSTISVLDQLVTTITGTATTIVGNPGQPGTGGLLPLPDALLPRDVTQAPVLSVSGSAAPLTAQQTLVLGGLFAAALAVGSVAPIASASGSGTARWGWPLAPSGSSGTPGILSSTTAAAATLWAALVEFSWRAHPNGAATRSLADDALPGAPVFATDVSPD